MAALRLPSSIPPAQHEVTASYVARLAHLHGMDFHLLWEQVTRPIAARSSIRTINPAALASATGRPLEHLAGALPELRTPKPDWSMFRHEPQPGCHLCTARHPGGRIVHLLPHHLYVCTKHRIWIGPPDTGEQTTPLDALPEVVHAQHRHLRLIRRRGWEVTYDAVLTGLLVCAQLWSLPEGDNGAAWHNWVRRANLLIPPGTSETTFSVARLCAAVYPEAIDLASVFASLYWRHQAQGTPMDRSRFEQRIDQLLRHPVCQLNDGHNPISHWADVSSRLMPLTPIRVHGDKRPAREPHLRKPSLHSATRRAQQRHAQTFDPTHRAGEPLIAHRHLATVVRRAWSPFRAPRNRS
ncbi:TniQ family protein [Streptomyces sp. NPDC002221]|uniref:TniQ family protein n=1 Tax=Streptomyces sp. NPDC002221 TaxID=3364639 RepID=UPI0036B7FFED